MEFEKKIYIYKNCFPLSIQLDFMGLFCQVAILKKEACIIAVVAPLIVLYINIFNTDVNCQFSLYKCHKIYYNA